MRLLNKPYLDKYQPPIFSQFDSKKGSTIKHVSKFLDTMGPFVGDEDLCLGEFSKSLCGRAYTWYISLKPRFILTWVDMVDVFCNKYFHG